MAKFDPYDDEYDPDIEEDFEEYASKEDRAKHLEAIRDSRVKRALRDSFNEIGRVPPLTQDIKDLRQKYTDDYVSAHQDIFTQSTGLKPFGQIQIDSVKRTHHVLTHGGKSVIAEPRGFGKSSRTANNSLLAVLQGKVKYCLILASSVTKAEDILESIKTELIDNEHLQEMYPAICACFNHVADAPVRGVRQTYLGEKTHIGFTKHLIRFPVIPGEPSSGSIIQVRSKDNVRGLAVKVRFGEHAGKVLRPDFCFMDDIQTDEEAESPTTVYKIVQTIKKSVLFAGSHSRRISAVMCCTPICPGDVSSHFILNELSWDCIVSPMMVKPPTNIDKWIGDYANILTNFDRYETGARTKAQLRAREYVEANYEEMHEGAEMAWEWAFGWAEDPQTEISALQHAMNFKIEEGDEAFESECQCRVEPITKEAEGVKATLEEIMNKTHDHPRRACPVEVKYITTHVDINKDILTYATIASPQDYRPMCIDKGTWPEQSGMTWKKGSIVQSIARHYSDIPEEHEQRYYAIRDLINKLGAQTYARDDGLVMQNMLISIDMGYSIDEVQRAIRDSNYRNITCCYRGQGILAKHKPFMERHYGPATESHFHCATVPSRDRTLTVLYADVNHFKTMFHKGIKTRPDINNSFSFFTPEISSEMLLTAKHCIAETPEDDYHEPEDRHVTIWKNLKDDDNEYFDNCVGAIANLFKLGCEISTRQKPVKKLSISDHINRQKESYEG